MMESTVVSLAKKLRDTYNRFEADQPQTLDLFTEDITYTDPRFPPFEGKDALKEYLKQLAGENKVLQVSWEFRTVISEDDRVAVEWEVRTGVEFGGKSLEFSGAAFMRVRDGKICYYRGYWDTAVLQQLMNE
jgi:ketosteroid isomerase-like protein